MGRTLPMGYKGMTLERVTQIIQVLSFRVLQTLLGSFCVCPWWRVDNKTGQHG